MTVQAITARRVRFSSAHFYKQEKFSDDENRTTFGACYTTYGHGHNYVLEVFIEGVVDALDSALFAVVSELDHRHLNFDVPAFAPSGGRVPTTENIALYLRDRLLERLGTGDGRLQRLRLYETDDLWVEVWE